MTIYPRAHEAALYAGVRVACYHGCFYCSYAQFGPAAPLMFIPCGAAPPSCFQIYPEPPPPTHRGHQGGPTGGAVGTTAVQGHDGDGCSGGGGGGEGGSGSGVKGGVFVMATLHGACWKQLEQAVRGAQGQGGRGGLSGLI